VAQVVLATRPRVAAACLLAGGLVAFAMPPWGWWPSAYVGLAALVALLAGRPWRSRARRGALVGAGWLFPATFWMIDLTAPGYVIAGLLFSGLLGLLCVAVPPSGWRYLALPAAVVLFEAVRWRAPFGGVPLATLPMSQVGGPLAPTVRLLGPLLLSALTVALAVALAAAFERRYWLAAAVVTSVVLTGLGGRVAPHGDPVDSLAVAIVQGGGPQNTRAVSTDLREVFERHLAASALVETPVDLVLWPEDVVHVVGPVEETTEYTELQALARQLDAVLVPGIFERVSDTANRNASIVLDPDGGQLDRYDKVRIVPFGEYVPFRGLVEPFAPDYLPVREVERGTGPAVVHAPLGGRDVALGVSISWEIFFEDRARDAMANGAELLLNPTNGSSYWLTIVQTQQVASSRLRALETGRWVLQAAPTGFSAIVDPDGTVHQRTGVSEQAVLHGIVELRTGRTLATRVGVWPMVLAALLALALAMWIEGRGRRSSRG
jgi:apolipoprotein N-acyltransferase